MGGVTAWVARARVVVATEVVAVWAGGGGGVAGEEVDLLCQSMCETGACPA